MGITDWVSKYTGHKYRKLKREHESEKKAGYKDALLKESYELRDEMYKDIGKMDDYL
ncbi:hypothetical protein HY643_00935, partial [Candidatus Woesearchaeota archaeon]|nr:hypothetical protein [Candidatus Woesearchaeota archaeon]